MKRTADPAVPPQHSPAESFIGRTGNKAERKPHFPINEGLGERAARQARDWQNAENWSLRSSSCKTSMASSWNLLAAWQGHRDRNGRNHKSRDPVPLKKVV